MKLLSEADLEGGVQFNKQLFHEWSVVQRLFHSDWFRGTRHQLFSHAN